MNKPNFFIVGAAKSGTTSLVRYLTQHPDIYFCPVKEPFYFIKGRGIEDSHEYLKLFSKAGNARAIGEGSTGYLFDEDAPVLIKEFSPLAKIIIMLRNPVEMAYSYWQYMRNHHDETMPFEEAISNEERRYRKSEEFKKACFNWWPSYIYLERGLYSRQVNRYINVFGKSKVKVVIFERFVIEPEQTCQDIFTFLNIDPRFKPDCSSIENSGGQIRARYITRLRMWRFPLRHFLKELIPIGMRDKIRWGLMNFNIKKNSQKLQMNETTRRRMEEFFCEDIKETERLLGTNIPEWRPR